MFFELMKKGSLRAADELVNAPSLLSLRAANDLHPPPAEQPALTTPSTTSSAVRTRTLAHQYERSLYVKSLHSGIGLSTLYVGMILCFKFAWGGGGVDDSTLRTNGCSLPGSLRRMRPCRAHAGFAACKLPKKRDEYSEEPYDSYTSRGIVQSIFPPLFLSPHSNQTPPHACIACTVCSQSGHPRSTSIDDYITLLYCNDTHVQKKVVRCYSVA